MPLDADWIEDCRIMELLRSGTVEDLEHEAAAYPSFPDGQDRVTGRRWIINAIDEGSLLSIQWMISKGVELDFRDDEGYTVLLTALEFARPVRHAILELLLRSGARTDLAGINEWTPAHMAASRDDVEALKILKKYGANLRAVRNDFGPSTPLEDARVLNCRKAAEYLEREA